MTAEAQDGDVFWEPDIPAGADFVTSELKVKRSLFIGHLGLCRTERDVRGFLGLAEAEHRNATHNCWAYCLSDPEAEHCSDDGEPSGTAGRPILSAVRQSGMVNLMVVVTRYFGGVKLGVRGLIDAYGQAAGNVLGKAGRVLRMRSRRLSVSLPYGSIGEVTGLLDACGTSEAPAWQYGVDAEVCAGVRLSAVSRITGALEEMRAKKLVFSWGWRDR